MTVISTSSRVNSRVLRIPMLVLLVVLLGSLYLGLSRKFAFASAPTVLPLAPRKKVDVIMAPSGAGVPARIEPAVHRGEKAQQSDRVQVVDGRRIGEVAHLRRVPGDDDEVVHAELVSREQVRDEAERMVEEFYPDCELQSLSEVSEGEGTATYDIVVSYLTTPGFRFVHACSTALAIRSLASST